MKRKKYSFSTLRYVYDLGTGEFFTVGVAVFEPDTRFLKFRFLQRLDAAAQLLGKRSTDAFSGMIGGIRNIAQEIEQRVNTELPQSHSLISLNACLQALFVPDDSALQWTEIQYGLSADLEATTNHLFKRYCQRFDSSKPKPRQAKQKRTVADVSRHLRQELKGRRLDGFFQEKIIKGENAELQFDFSWKNGEWHCIEPVSLDLKTGQGIRKSVYNRAGELVAVSDALKNVKIYYVAARPADSKLDAEFDNALEILMRSPGQPEAYDEEHIPQLLDRFSQMVGESNR